MAFVCTNPDCNLAETGKCVDGFEIGQCPHVKNEIETSLDEGTEESILESPIEVASVTIPGGEILTIDEATDVLRSRVSRVITVIGPSDSGKTTFALCLYEALQSGPFDRWSFAGSMTLPAFEKRCHFSRINCGAINPDTTRTPRTDGLGFLHLEIKDEQAGYLDILISDRSGEYYEDVTASLENCDDIHEVSRADYLLFFVDGNKLGTDERHGLITEIKLLVRSLIESGVLRNGQRIGIVLTKYDQVDVSPVKQRIEDDFNNLVSNIRDCHGSKVTAVNGFRIAARPDSENFELRFGIVGLLEECFKAPPLTRYLPDPVSYPDRVFLHLHVPVED